jgi:hypothetical protein
MKRSSFLEGLIDWMNEGGLCTFHKNSADFPGHGGKIDPFQPVPVPKPPFDVGPLDDAKDILDDVDFMLLRLSGKHSKETATPLVTAIEGSLTSLSAKIKEYLATL